MASTGMAGAGALVVACAAMLPAAAAAQGAPAPAAQIAGAGRDCVSATVMPGKVDPAALTKSGWQAATFRDRSGKAVASAVQMFGKKDVGATIVVSGPIYATTARLVAEESPEAVATALDTVLAAPRRNEPGRPGHFVWFQQDRLISLEPTGSAGTPAVRIAVMNTSEEKK